MDVRPAGSGFVRRLRLNSPIVRILVLGVPLAAMTSVLAGSAPEPSWVVPSSANAGNQAWLNELVGPAPTTSPGEIPPPDVAVIPSGGDPQVLVLPGPAGTSGDTGGGRGASVPEGGPDTGALTGNGIPRRVLQAYVAAAQETGRIDPSCHVTWPLLAGIGRVETDHGRFGGAHVLANGLITPPIYGPRLNGTGGMPFVHDTDGGRLDGDAGADRAMGPMQFIPGTWSGYGTDADGDGVADPQDVDDAALSAARYLCAGGGDLSTHEGQGQAVFRYNHSTSYVQLVLALADSYASGEPVPIGSESAVTTSSSGGTSATGDSPPAVDPSPLPTPGSGSPSPSPVTSPKPSQTPSPSTSPRPSPSPSSSPTPSPSTSVTPTPSPSSSPTPPPSVTPTPSPSTTPTPSPSATPTPTPTATPTPSASSTPP